MKKIYLFLVILLFVSPFAYAQNAPQNEAEEEILLKIKSSAELGLRFSNGNNKEESIFSKGEIELKKDKWTDIFKARTSNEKDEDIRTKEEYFVNNQLRYSFSKRNYVFKELEFASDRFGGYSRRFTEVVGFGRNVIEKEDYLNLSLRFGGGFRQTKFIDQETENNWIARIGGDFDWQIMKNLSFKEVISFSLDENAGVTESDASLKLMINSSVYLRLSHLLEHQSSVPAGIKNTDSTTMLTLGYQFQ